MPRLNTDATIDALVRLSALYPAACSKIRRAETVDEHDKAIIEIVERLDDISGELDSCRH